MNLMQNLLLGKESLGYTRAVQSAAEVLSQALATVTSVAIGNHRWSWEARTDLSCQRNQSGLPFQGYASTLEGAKAIVETLLVETDTVPIHKSYQKEVLDEGHAIYPAQ